MLDLVSGRFRDCRGLDRRRFLRVGALAGLGISLPAALAARKARLPAGETASSPNGATRDVNCILIWTRGGTSHHDTFDPKPQAPVSVRGEFGTIDTSVPGVQFTDVVPRMAKELGRFSVLRSWNPENGSHGVADQWMMSGHNHNPTVHYPCYGSIISHQKGFKTKMPPFVQLGDNVDRTFGGGTAGYLSAEHNAFEMHSDPNATPFSVRDITPPRGVDAVRISRRRRMMAKVDSLARRADVQPAAYLAQDEHFRTALEMISAPETQHAFEIDSEDPRLRERYGRSYFGQSCLLARRLIESGVRFVTVSDGGWDHHTTVFSGIKSRIPSLDQAIPELLIDLELRGLLETTLVVWLTDFGRTPKINSASGRDHWATAGFAIAAGAGVPGGLVLGRTDDEGGRPTHDEYRTADIAATIYSKLGIPLDLITTTADGRPIRLNEGRPIKEWM